MRCPQAELAEVESKLATLGTELDTARAKKANLEVWEAHSPWAAALTGLPSLHLPGAAVASLLATLTCPPAAQAEVKMCEEKLDRAQKLIGGLGGEKVCKLIV